MVFPGRRPRAAKTCMRGGCDTKSDRLVPGRMEVISKPMPRFCHRRECNASELDWTSGPTNPSFPEARLHRSYLTAKRPPR